MLYLRGTCTCTLTVGQFIIRSLACGCDDVQEAYEGTKVLSYLRTFESTKVLAS